MIGLLTRASLTHRTVVMLLAALVAGLGAYTATALKQELIPNIEIPQASVISAYVGATPQAVEREVTTPLEDAIEGVSGVTQVTSTSISGFSQIQVAWEFGLDADTVQTQIRNAISSVQTTLPDDVTPTVVAGSFDDIPVIVLAVSSNRSEADLSKGLRDIAVPALQRLDGVRSVTLSGERTRQVAITLRQADIEELGIDADLLSQTFAASSLPIPAGTVQGDTANLDVQVGTQFTSIDQIKAMQIQGADGPVALSEFADVVEEDVAQTSISRASGRPALTLSITKETAGNTVAVAHEVNTILPTVIGQLGDGVEISTVFDQAPYIEQSVHDLTVEGGLGLAMAILVILLFLRSIRPTAITALSIPISLLIALIGLWVGGYTLNIITLGALTVAVGRVVDDSIVVVENIKRHQALGRYGPAEIVRAVREVGGAVTSSTLTTVAVFLPIGLVGGQAGETFRPFAIAVSIALLASLVVSLTVVPVLASWFMRPPADTPKARERAARFAEKEATGIAADRARDQAAFERKHATLLARLERRKATPETIAYQVDKLRARYGVGDLAALDLAADNHAESAAKQTWLQRGYLPVLRWSLAHRALTLLIAVAIFLGTMMLTPLLKTDFIGAAGATSLQINQELPAGTSLTEMDAAAQRVEKIITNEPTVESWSTTVGSGSGAFSFLSGASDTNVASHAITLEPNAPGQEIADKLRNQLADLGADQIGTTEVFVGGASGEIAVYVEASDLDALTTANAQVLDLFERTEGLSNIESDLTEAKAMLQVTLDDDAAAAAGMMQAQVGAAVARATRGQQIGTLTQDDSTLNVLLFARKPVTSLEELRSVVLPVTQKQTIDARTAAAEQAQEDADAFADRQEAEATEAYQDSLRQLRESRDEAADQLAELRATLRQLQQALRAPIPTLPPGVQVPVDPYAEIRQQITQIESAITGQQAQIEALDDQYDSLVEQREKSQAVANEQAALQEAAQDAQKVTATPLTLDEIADIDEVEAPASISHVAGERTATVSAVPTGSDLGGTTAALQLGLDALDLPDGASVSIGGVSAEQQDSFAQLGLAMLIAIAIVYLIMVGTFGSLVQPLVLLVSIPFAATGAVGLSLITDTPLGIPSMIGLLMLIGIVVTNAIVLIDLINQYRRDGVGATDAIMHGARLRLRPIVMTALATIMALVPMSLGLTGGGVFISRPLAIVVIGGLVSSTLLTLLLVPVLYSLVEGARRRFSMTRTQPRPPAALPAAMTGGDAESPSVANPLVETITVDDSGQDPPPAH
ncbi:MAG: efflux RND transporter permease subunit [Propioniciclava sp.]